jgi:WD40 repeat protein
MADTNKERILAYLRSITPSSATNSEIVANTGIRPHQQVYALTQELVTAGLILGEQIGREWSFRVSDSSLDVPTLGDSMTFKEESRLTSRAFEALAREVMSARFGVGLKPGAVPEVQKQFDMVSSDGAIVGDTKYYSLVRGELPPPAKFSNIAEHVWLLEKTHAKTRFLVFGNDPEVPKLWLSRYGGLLENLSFYFLTDNGQVTQLWPPLATMEDQARHDAHELRGIRQLHGHTETIRCVATSSDNELIASGSDDKSARVWDIHTGHEIRLFGHQDEIYSIVFSPDRELLYCGDKQGVIHCWDVKTATDIRQFVARSEYPLYDHSLSISPNGRYLLSVDGYGPIRVWDTSNGSLIRNLEKVHEKDHYYGWLAISADGQRCMCDIEIADTFVDDERDDIFEYTYNEPAMWDLATGKEVDCVSFIQKHLCDLFPPRGWVWDRPRSYVEMVNVAFSSDGRLVSIRCPETDSIYVWNIDDQRLLCHIEFKAEDEYGLLTRFLPDDQRLIILTEARISIYSAYDGRILSSLTKPDGFGHLQTISRDGRYALTTLGSDSRPVITLWTLPI